MSTTSWDAKSNNQNDLQDIQEWWTGLDDKSVTMTEQNPNLLFQKIGSPDQISKSSTIFTIQNPQMQDNKLIWYKDDLGNDFNIPAQKLNLDESKKQLTIVSQEQPPRRWSFTVNALK